MKIDKNMLKCEICCTLDVKFKYKNKLLCECCYRNELFKNGELE